MAPQGIKDYDSNKPPCDNDDCPRSAKWVVVHGKYGCDRHVAKLEREHKAERKAL